jgi:hypothetical protein
MFEYLPLLFALACPLGMLAMMAAPALVRRFRRFGEDGAGERSAGAPQAR